MLQVDRKAVVEFFGQRKMIEVETALVIVELINQDRLELSKMVLQYLDLILRKDEICL